MDKEGWQLVRTRRSHHPFKHPDREYLITIPHPKKDLGKGLVKKIKTQAGLK